MPRAQRARPAHDPWRPLGVQHERERWGELEVDASTIFLVGAECPFSCVFCDLWKHTLDVPTPVGAIPRQIEFALASIPHRQTLKLYNASNFFDERAVPEIDEAAILEITDEFSRLIVECHPRLVADRCRRFAGRSAGRLEVAMGLETVHPEVFAGLQKGMTLAEFDHAASRLLDWGVGLRVFVLLGLPGIAADDQVRWCGSSVAHAAALGAEVVSIVPLRPTATLPRIGPPALQLLEAAFLRALECVDAVSGRRVTVQTDPWDLEGLPACSCCGPMRRERLIRANLEQRMLPMDGCETCGWSGAS